MRNLKRALSLALASVMLVGMMVVGSSAASFPDVSAKDNTEAISVLNAVGVMLGDEDTGNFRPEDNVTRNEMAVILAKLILGSDADKYVGNCPFTDVPTWAQKYVTACYDNKIVAGRTESVYDGSAVVTAQEAAAMVLRVLGYEKLESTGTNWAQPVVAKANELRLFADVGSSASAPLNRNQVAQLSLNALQATMVTSDVEKDIVVEGVVTIPGKVTYTERTTNKFDYTQSNGAYKKDVSDEKLQLCENLYEKDLRLVPGTDDFGRPANIWSYKTDEIVTVAEAADASYIKAVKAEDLYKDLGLKDKTDATVVVDGAKPSDFSITKTGTDKIGGNGVVVDAYKDDEGKVSIFVINPYVGEVSKVTEAKGDDARTVTVGGMKFETEGFDVDDVVVYTKADGKIKSMYLAETVENVEITKTVGSSEFVADGETYKFAAQWASKTSDTTDLVENKAEVKKENKVDLYLDSNNFVVKVALNEGVTDYAYVLDIDVDSGKLFKNGTPYAKLLLTDGTVVEAELKFSDYADVDKVEGEDKKQEKLEEMFESFIVEYSKNSKDVYKLAAKSSQDVNPLSGTQTISIENGKAKLTLGDNKNIYADSKTIFLTDDGDDNYKAYTGYDAVPNLEGTVADKAAYNYYCKDNGTVATVVYVLNTTGSSDDIVFLLGKECGDEINVKDGDNYYECPAVVNGEIETVKLDAKIKDNKLLKSITWANEDEEIISVAKSKAYDDSGDNYYVSGKVEKKLTNGNITVDGTSFRVADDAQVFVYSDKIESSSKTAIAAGDTGLFVVNDGKIVTIFYTEAADNSGSNGGNSGDVGTVTNDIVTAPSGADVKVDTEEDGSSTITVSGDSVNPVVPKEDRDDMYKLFGGAIFADAGNDGEKNGVPKPGCAIFTVDVLANVKKAPFYTIIQTNDALKMFSEDSNIEGNVKTKTYSVADLQDGLSLILLDKKGATLSVTPVLKAEGDTAVGDTIVITIKNSATFVSKIEVNSSTAADEAVKNPANQEIVITGNVTLSQATGANQKVIVEANQKVTVGTTGNQGVFTGEGTVVVNKDSGNVSVVDTNVEVGAITGTVKVAAGESKTEITVTETPAANGKIEIAKNAVVDIKTEGEAKITAEDLTIGEGAKVTINGNLVGESAAPVSRTVAATGLTIPAKTEVVVNGKIGAGVEITIKGDNGLTVNGEVEKGAQITAETQEAFKIGDKTKVNEVITLSLSDKNVQLTKVVPFIPWKISGEVGQGYKWPSDVSTNTVFVFVQKNGTKNGNFYLTKGAGTDKYLETTYTEETNIGWGAYFSLDNLKDGHGQDADENPFTVGDTWVTHTIDGNGNEHVHSFTAWAGPAAQGEA